MGVQTIMVFLFWLSLILLVYPYIGYPPLIRFLARRYPISDDESVDSPETPFVTLIISAYNEAAIIAAKLDNAQALEYPSDKYEILVVSDASSDETDSIVRSCSEQDKRVRLLRQEERRGKSAGLNHAVTVARGDVLVFSDANAMYEPDALQELVRPFTDPEVGYVVGAQRYRSSDETESQSSEGLYWRLELWLKEQESAYSGVVGGDGAIYALRKGLYHELRDDDLSDFVNPLFAVAQGYRGVFNPNATCWEEAGESYAQEFGRKRRIVNRSWRAVRRYLSELSWEEHARYLFALISHKVLRWYATLFTAIAILSGFASISGGGIIHLLLVLGLIVSVALAYLGHRKACRGEPLPRLIGLLYYFHMSSLAGLLGIVDEYRGIRNATWEHVRNT